MLAGQGFLHVDASRELLLIPLREIPGRHSPESLRERLSAVGHVGFLRVPACKSELTRERSVAFNVCGRQADKKKRCAAQLFPNSSGPYGGASDQACDLPDRDAAWAEMTGVCGDLVASISRDLKQNTEWQMELFGPIQKARV